MNDINCSAESLFLNAAKIVKPSGIFYVGAYKGGELEIFKDFNCPVYSFEPNSNHFEELQSKYKKFNIAGEAFSIGCGNFTGTVQLNIPDYDQVAASILKTHTITSRFPHMIQKNKQNVRIITLDSMNITDSNYLILDVQGSEFDTILGAYETIKNYIDVIIVEYSSDDLYSNQNKIYDLNLLLNELGFFTKSYLNHVHADALYLKNTYFDSVKDLPMITHPIIYENGEGSTHFEYHDEWKI
jgi:FkbM family methyltransferase